MSEPAPVYDYLLSAEPGVKFLHLFPDDPLLPDFNERLRALAPGLIGITMMNMDLPTLPEALRHCTRLRLLLLNSVRQLRALPPWLGELTSLEELYLDNSEHDLWSHWPPELNRLQRLRTLHLGVHQQEMTALSPVIGTLAALEQLVLRGTSSVAAPTIAPGVWDVIGQLRELRILALPGYIAELSDLLPALPHLHTLQFKWVQQSYPPGHSSGQVHPFPPQLAQCTALRQLKLDGRYETLPPELFALRELRELDISGSSRALPAAIGQLRELRRLDISNQFLETLPPEIGQLTHLIYLRVKGNLRAVPAEMVNLGELRLLDLSNNCHPQGLEGGFPVVPAVVGQLRRLEELYLARNQVHTVPPN